MNGRILIAGTGSGSGKTSVVCGLLAALRARGLRAAACKCGPDYIDPLFHREVLGEPSRNLDLFLCGEAVVRALLAESVRDADITVIEGVMGLYDGLDYTAAASSHHLARVTGTPVLLVADCKGKSLTLAAELQGLVRFRENSIAGILLNRCTARSYPRMKALVEEAAGRPVLGYLPSLPAARLDSRHLGLVTAAEVTDLRERVAVLARQMEETVELDAVLGLARAAPPLGADYPTIRTVTERPVRVAVAQDEAFCFAYADNHALLEALGAVVVPFSPLADRTLPPGCAGLLLPGGYPELHAAQLATNGPMLAALRRAVEMGMPTIAECGGFMVLCESIRTAGGEAYRMAGALPAAVRMTGRLSRFGYVTLTARRDNLLCGAGERIRAHEFHYSEADDPGAAFRAEKAGGAAWDSVYATPTLYAGYPHLHLWGNGAAARRFVARCAQFERERDG